MITFLVIVGNSQSKLQALKLLRVHPLYRFVFARFFAVLCILEAWGKLVGVKDYCDSSYCGVTRMSASMKILLGLGLFLIANVAGIGIVLFLKTAQAPTIEDDLPELYPVPSFSLTDQTGSTFGLDDLSGKLWVAKFFFTSCSGPCPRMSANLADVSTQFADDDRIHFVSFTVDPATDTPERLAEYADFYNADPMRWHFLTGALDVISELALEGFKLGSPDSPVHHADRFILVDNAGIIRGYYAGTETEGVQRLIAAIKQLRADF